MGASRRAAMAVAAALALAAPASASAAEPGAAAGDCRITHNADDPMADLIRREKYDDSYFKTLCPWLAANGLELSISSDSGTIDRQPYPWVSVRLMRTASQITGTRASQTTVLPEPSGSAEIALRQALDSALTALTDDRQHHLRELAAREAAATATHRQKGT